MYITNKFLYRVFLYSIDFYSKIIKRNENKVERINKILLSNIGHLGDIVISTAMINLIKSNYPQIQIGFLTSSLSKSMVKENKQIDFIHTFDHVMLIREKNIFYRLINHCITGKKSKKEIKSIQYDVAIDLRHFYPNSILLLYKSKIPNIIGFNSGGFGPLLNISHDWENKNQHLSIYHLELIREIFPQIDKSTKLEVNLGFSFDIKKEDELLKSYKLEKNNYIIFHPGTGNPVRRWPLKNWKHLAKLFINQGKYIVFTGKGYSDKEDIDSIVSNFSSNDYLNLCDKLDLLNYCTIVKYSTCLVGVESLSGHIAGALNKSAIIIGSGTTNKYQWKPLGKYINYITEDIACSPCYVGSGCGTMDCINLITPSVVYNEINKFVKQ